MTADRPRPHPGLTVAPPVFGESGENGSRPLALTQPLWALLSSSWLPPRCLSSALSLCEGVFFSLDVFNLKTKIKELCDSHRDTLCRRKLFPVESSEFHIYLELLL